MKPEEIAAALGPAAVAWVAILDDAQRFRWLLTQPYEAFAELQRRVHETLASSNWQHWPEGMNCPDYDAAFDAQIRAEIDRRRER